MDEQKTKLSTDLSPKFRKLRKEIESAEQILLTGHVRADGDCVGAQSALFHLLVGLGKKVTILNPDPLSPRYSFLRQHTPFESYDAVGKLPPFDALFVLDVNTLDRTGAMAEPLRKSNAKKFVFDHHLPGEKPENWELDMIDPSAAATGVLVYRFAKAEGLSLSPAAAQGVFLSIVTDTGWFKYSNADSEAFRVASELIAAGVDPSIIFQHVYQQRSLEWTKGLTASLETVEFKAKGRLAIVKLPEGESKDAAAELADSEEILDILRAVKLVEVVALFRPDDKNKVKLSLRSKGDFNVNQFAKKLGGGGHRRASGAEVAGTLDRVAAKVGSDLAAEVAKQFGLGPE